MEYIQYDKKMHRFSDIGATQEENAIINITELAWLVRAKQQTNKQGDSQVIISIWQKIKSAMR